MAWKYLTNIRGPKGDKGFTGEAGPQGLPGTGAVPADEAVAGYVSTAGASATKAALLDGFIERHGRRGVERRIYVRAGATGTGDGSSATDAFTEIRDAVASLEADGAHVRGSVVIDVGAGTYKGGIQFPVTRTTAADDFVKIVGPPAGHPNVPTVTIAKSADETATFGIQALNGWWVWVEDVKIVGAFYTALDMRTGVTIQRRNVHIDGAQIGVNVTDNVADHARGGIVENCTLYGVQEMYGVIRTYTGGATGSTVYRNCKFGIYSKTSRGGHLDYATFDGCEVGVHLDRSSANLLGVKILNSTVAGISIKDSEIHNTASVVWTANARRLLQYGPGSSDSDSWGWTDGAQSTVRTGATPPICIASSYPAQVVSGTTAETTIANFVTLLRADRYAVKGKRLQVRIIAVASGAPSGSITVRIKVASSSVISLVIPAGTTGGSVVMEAEMVCTADGNNQLWSAKHITQNGSQRGYHAVATTNLTDADRTVTVSAQLANAGDSFTVHAVEVFG